jgi:hypothetical protein
VDIGTGGRQLAVDSDDGNGNGDFGNGGDANVVSLSVGHRQPTHATSDNIDYC